MFENIDFLGIKFEQKLYDIPNVFYAEYLITNYIGKYQTNQIVMHYAKLLKLNQIEIHGKTKTCTYSKNTTMFLCSSICVIYHQIEHPRVEDQTNSMRLEYSFAKNAEYCRIDRI